MKKRLFYALLYLVVLQAHGQIYKLAQQPIELNYHSLDDSLRGLSGIEYIPNKNEWYIVSDRGKIFAYNNIQDFSEFDKPQRLKAGFPKRTPYYFESIRYDNNRKGFYFSTEESTRKKPERDSSTSVNYIEENLNSPAICLFKLDSCPSHNKGIEAIALTPSGHLWVAPEAGWQGETSLDNPIVHFYRFKTPDVTNSLPDSLTYPIERFRDAIEENRPGGISEILSLNDSILLVLERAYFPGRVSAKIWKVKVNEATHSLSKELAFNFDDREQFSSILCNVEGMTWGPLLPNGKQRLVLIADDNFTKQVSSTLKNQLIILEELWLIRLKLIRVLNVTGQI